MMRRSHDAARIRIETPSLQYRPTMDRNMIRPGIVGRPGAGRWPDGCCRCCHFCCHLDLRITRVFSCVARGLKARASFMFAGGCRWRSLAVDGSSGASRGHAPVARRPGSRWGGAVERPSAFQAGHMPSWRVSCECYALSPVAAGGHWWLLLLSRLLSAAVRGAGGRA
jgi:hypothetical protein